MGHKDEHPKGRKRDEHQKLDDLKALIELLLREFRMEVGEEEMFRKSVRRSLRHLAAIEALLKKILELLDTRREAVSLNPSLGVAIPEGAPFLSTSALLKGATTMNLVTSQTVGTKCLVTLHPADSDNQPATIDQTDEVVAVESTNPAVVSVSDLASDGLSFQMHFLAAGTASVSIKADADLDAAEIRDLIDTIDCTVIAAGKPEAATLGIVIGPSVAEGDPIPA